MSSVITRYPPSPTGHPHVGGMRTALFNYLYAKKNGGKIVLRFEDTDKARSKKEFEDSNFESLQWLGLSFDEVNKQSERTEVYKKHLEKMIADGTAYISDEAAFIDEEGEGEDAAESEKKERRLQVIRFKNPNKQVTFTDLVTGDITVDTTELKDFVIAKSLEEPLYHLAVVVDDFEMGITHVIRGVDGIYNTPRQILIQEAIGAGRPVYCHIPFILGPDKAKLSKRNGSLPVTYYRDQGFLPEALLNYLALLGWHPSDDKEIFTLSELIEAFELEKIQKAGAVFDIEKLKWVNREHIARLSPSDLRDFILKWIPERIRKLPQWSDERYARFEPELKDRIAIGGDITALADAGELDYIFDKPTYEASALFPKSKDGSPADPKKTEGHLAKVIEILGGLSDEDFKNKEKIKEALWGYATEAGRGEVFWPMRLALSGKERSPDPFTLASVFGKTETLQRLTDALKNLSE